MPTAVERLAGLLKDIFSLNIIESPIAQAAFRYLDSRIDAGFAALNGATSRSAFAAAERQYGHGLQELGAGTFVLGAELQKDAVALGVIGSDIFGGGGGSGRGGSVSDIFGGGGGSGSQADLAHLTRDLFKAGHDLEVFGKDFALVGQATSHDAFVAVEARFHPDLQRLQDDFIGLGVEADKFTRDLAAEWGGGGGSGTNGDIFGGGGGSGFTADQAGLLRGISQLGGEFSDVGHSFGKLAEVWGGGGGSGTNADIFGGGGGSGFAALHENFTAVDSTIAGLARPLAGLLLPAVHVG